MNEPRDTLVGDALRRIDVPDHAPDFWSRLEASLAEGSPATDEPDTDEPANDGEETTVVDLESSPAAKRASDRNRTPMLVLAAAVAVVVALVVGVAALRGGGGDDESQLDTADDPTEAPETPDTSDPDVAPPPTEDEAAPGTSAPRETGTSVPSEENPAAAAEETAVAWINALRAGDMATAYEMLDDQSQADLDRTRFEEISTGLAEGAAAFGAGGIGRSVAAIDAASGVFHVVTFSGDVEREGMVETASYPVVVTDTGVHFTPDGPQLTLDPEYARSSGTTLTPPLQVLVSDTADTWLWIDDGEAPERFLSPGRLELGAEAIGGPGTHVVSLVAIEDGRITAQAYTVVVP